MFATEVDGTEATTQLLDLNDDCLLEIFKYLSLQETLALLGTICQRIEYIIYESLSRIKHLTISLRDPPQLTEQQLEILGRNLNSVYISAGYSLPALLTLNYLQPICKQKKLQFLTLHYIHFDEIFQHQVLQVAAQLHFLDLSYCHLTDHLLGPVLAECQNLRTLAIFGNYQLACVSLNCLNSSCLKEVKVEQNTLSKNQISTFKKNNPQIVVTIFSIGNLDHFRSHLA